MRRNFVQVQQWLEQTFPELEGKVTGENYAAPALVELLMKVLSGVQLVGILFVFLGTNVFSMIGLRYVPAWYESVSKNGTQIAILVYLLLPQILGKYMITGAFEVFLDGSLIYSKIQTGRLPQYPDLLNPLKEAGLRRG